MTEITEDNCVLEDFELEDIEKALVYYSVFLNESDKLYENFKIEYFQKITKLNELVKQARKEIDLNQVDSVFQLTEDKTNE